MAGKQLGAAMRQFQRLFNAGTVAGLADDQLLNRFVSHRDDAAFEALVERHGPMVLSVCRGVLKDPNDAQDAFQATFLVLVRKAGSIRAGASLGSWLFRVAHNMAIQINADAARRQRLERRAGEMANPTSKDPSCGDDLVPALYEEVNRLPEKYRLPVVLCHLEEMSHAQAARQLGWTEGTVRGRVAKAREVLRHRLARRGLALSAGAIASKLTERSASASATAVPAAWVDGTVKAAMAIAAGRAASAGTVSAASAVFSERMARSMLMTRLKLTAAALLASGGAAFVAATLAAGLGEGAIRKASPPAGGVATSKAVAKVAAPQPDERSRPVPVAGRVIGPDGRPVAGAKLYVTPIYESGRSPSPTVRATTGADGRFSLDVTPAERDAAARMPKDERKEEMFPLFVAMSDGFGPGFDFHADKAGDRTIRLVSDDVPVEGRILNVEGRPVAGARVQVVSIYWSPEEDLTRWHDALRVEKTAYPVQQRLLKWWLTPAVIDLFPAAITGADGRFTIRGIGRERIAGIMIGGPSIRTTIENVVTRHEPTMRVQPQPGPEAPFVVTYYGARFDHVGDPSRPVVGVVRDKDTGKPIAGAVVRSTLLPDPFNRYVGTKTGADGRYRLDGLMILTERKLFGDELMVEAPEGEPYLPAVHSIIEPAAAKSVARDFALKRGIWIKGKVIDKATGRGHRASVDYFLFKDNPRASEAAHFGYDRYASGHHLTDDDGTFRLEGLPGHGLLCARAGNEPYRMGVGAERIKATAMTRDVETIDVLPGEIIVNNFHVLAEINPPDGLAETSFELALDRGQVIQGRLLDPEGRPLAGARPCGLADWWGSWGESLTSADFEVSGLAPGDVRTIAFLHPERKLAGSAILRAETRGPIEVKLEPWGTLTGRLVDETGEPRAGVDLVWWRGGDRRAQEGQGTLRDDVKTSADGRFRIEGLAPGLKYSLQVEGRNGFDGYALKDATIKAGETRDLGDVKGVGR